MTKVLEEYFVASGISSTMIEKTLVIYQYHARVSPCVRVREDLGISRLNNLTSRRLSLASRLMVRQVSSDARLCLLFSELSGMISAFACI